MRMNERNQNPNTENPRRRRRPAKALRRHKLIRNILRGTMMFLTIVLMLLVAAWNLLDAIFNGPSVSARDTLTRSLSYSSGTWWIPSVFLGEELAKEIITNNPDFSIDVETSDTTIIDPNGALNGENEEWKNYPDGIRIETVKGATFTAHVMIIRDPSSVYVGISTESFHTSIPGGRLNQIMEREGAIAGINGGAFLDNGTSGPIVGSVPYGLVVSEGRFVWNDGYSGPANTVDGVTVTGFVGFTEDNVMIVSKTINETQAREWKIRDGVCFGPALIMDGQINTEAYNNDAGWNPRTAIGQRADGAVIMVCIDGRQANGVGGSYADVIDIMIEYGAVNACCLDGGSSSIMYYRDENNILGKGGGLTMVNTYSALQEEPRRMPTFFLVKPSSED